MSSKEKKKEKKKINKKVIREKGKDKIERIKIEKERINK